MKSFLKDTAALLLGGGIFAAGLVIFAAPCNILTGGAGGIAIIINKLTGLSTGFSVLLVNLPLFSVAFFVCGRKYTLKTLWSTVVFSLIITVFEALFSFGYTSNPLLSSVFGGILTGFGMYILLSRSIVTGGSDLAAYIIQRLHPEKSIDFLILVIDGVIVLAGALLFESIDTALYSTLLIIMMTVVMGSQLRGRYQSFVFLIISQKPQKIQSLITDRLGRGYSVAEIRGGTGVLRKLIICAVSTKERALLRKLIFECDPHAFVIISQAQSVCGNGFIIPSGEEIF